MESLVSTRALEMVRLGSPFWPRGNLYYARSTANLMRVLDFRSQSGCDNQSAIVNGTLTTTLATLNESET